MRAAHNKMFLQWCGEVQAISLYLRSTFGFVGQDAASEAHHCRNTNVVGHVIGQMNRNKINWGLSIIVIVTLLSFLLTTWNEIEENNFKYGKDFNKVRDSLSVPRIEEDWVTHEDNQWRRHWGHPERGINSVLPTHLSKTSNFSADTLISEEDRFHYETEDSLAFRVVYKYQFDNTTWDCKFIRYRKEKYPPTSSWTLTLEQADSVLNKWGLSR